MATLNTYFRDFLQAIRPTNEQRQDMQTGHKTLRQRLASYEPLKEIVVSDFLQGSYRRSTAIRPAGGARSDVDIIVVTNLNQEDYPNPQEAMELFRPFVKKFYKGKYKIQGRSIGIELSYVDLDLVITSAPSEVDKKALAFAAVRSWDTPEDVTDWRLNEYWVPSLERNQHGAYRLLAKSSETPHWKTEPLWIPDRHAGEWQQTHPLKQIEWTFDKNRDTNQHYVNVVKAIKWWRLVKHPTPKHPKGYPLEHIVGDCCPDAIQSVAEGVTLTLEEICDRYSDGKTPDLRDRGVDQNVMERISDDDFEKFIDQTKEGAELARSALDEDDLKESAKLWRELLGNDFPKPPTDSKGGSNAGGGFSEPQAPSVPTRRRFS